MASKLGGRPDWNPTPKDRRLIETMVAGGIDQDRIAAAFKIAPKTLRKHCRAELNGGAERANGAVIASMFNMATAGRPAHVRFQAARFWLQCRAGWRDTERASLDMLIPIAEMSNFQFNQVMRINGLPTLDEPALSEAEIVPFATRLHRPRR